VAIRATTLIERHLSPRQVGVRTKRLRGVCVKKKRCMEKRHGFSTANPEYSLRVIYGKEELSSLEGARTLDHFPRIKLLTTEKQRTDIVVNKLFPRNLLKLNLGKWGTMYYFHSPTRIVWVLG